MRLEEKLIKREQVRITKLNRAAQRAFTKLPGVVCVVTCTNICTCVPFFMLLLKRGWTYERWNDRHMTRLQKIMFNYFNIDSDRHTDPEIFTSNRDLNSRIEWYHKHNERVNFRFIIADEYYEPFKPKLKKA